MKKVLLIGVATALLAGCSHEKFTDNTCLTGSWIQCINGIAGDRGISIHEDGSASSINMYTLLYETWKMEGRNLILTGQSIDNREVFTFVDTLNIAKLTTDSLVLTDDDDDYQEVYSRVKE